MDPEPAARLRKDILSYERVKVRQGCPVAQPGVSAGVVSVRRCIRPGLMVSFARGAGAARAKVRGARAGGFVRRSGVWFGICGTGVSVQGCRAANVWLRRRVIGNRGQAVARKCSNGLQQRRCRPLAHKNLLDGGRYVNVPVRHCPELPRPGQVDQGVGREGAGFSGEGYNNNLIVLQELEALSPPRWLKCCKVCSVCTNAAGSAGAVWRGVVRPRCQSGAYKAWASQAANAAGWRRPTAACSKRHEKPAVRVCGRVRRALVARGSSGRCGSRAGLCWGR